MKRLLIAINKKIVFSSKLINIFFLIKNRAIVWHEESMGSTFDIVEIPENLKEESKKYRALLIEEVASYDDNLLEKYMEDEDSITEDEIHSALRAAVMDMAIIPMICGSAFKNKGVQFLLDAVCRYLPSPVDKEAIIGKNPSNDEDISCLLYTSPSPRDS